MSQKIILVNGRILVNTKLFEQQTVFISGASQGIGNAIAVEMARLQSKVVLHYFRSETSLNDLAEQCLKLGAEVYTIQGDLSKYSEIKRIKQELDDQNVYPDILINNAGITHYGVITEVSESEWDSLISLNLKAMFFCSQMFIPHMIKQKFGKIINISSVWGLTGASCEVLYSTSKGGVVAFTKALAKELAPSQINVNCIAPGVVDTNMINNFSEEELEDLKKQIPMGRFSSALEIAKTVLFLTSSDTSYITGQTISPNGGWHM